MIGRVDLERRRRALGALCGLAVGDALGSQFFIPSNRQALSDRSVAPGPWSWTDDTEMACSVYAILHRQGLIDQDALAASFASHHDFDRGYGAATNRMLRLVREGGSWRQLSRELFDGQGSWGNGAAMRVAPLGAWYADDLDLVVEQAARSAEVTHTHPEAVAGAVAVAVAAGVAAGERSVGDAAGFLTAVADRVPASLVQDGIHTAAKMCQVTDPIAVAAVLGNGRQVSAQDTVPFALWAAAMYVGDYEAAFWATASAGGDIDTSCAIVGGVVSSGPSPAAKPPVDWLLACERLPRWMGRQAWPIVRPRPVPAPPGVWTDAQWRRIKAGYQARDMDERWNAEVIGDRLFLHRSWTGLGIFEARFTPGPDGLRITEALVETETSRYRSSSDEFETVQLEAVIRTVLLNEAAPELRQRLSAASGIAAPAGDLERGALLHHLLGTSRPADETGEDTV